MGNIDIALNNLNKHEENELWLQMDGKNGFVLAVSPTELSQQTTYQLWDFIHVIVCTSTSPIFPKWIVIWPHPNVDQTIFSVHEYIIDHAWDTSIVHHID